MEEKISDLVSEFQNYLFRHLIFPELFKVYKICPWKLRQILIKICIKFEILFPCKFQI